MPISDELLSLLVCPESKKTLLFHEEDGQEFLVSTDSETRRRYRVDNNIPIMLVDDSSMLDPAVWAALMKAHGRGELVSE